MKKRKEKRIEKIMKEIAIAFVDFSIMGMLVAELLIILVGICG